MRVLIIDPDEARAALVAQGLEGMEPLAVLRRASFDRAEAAAYGAEVVVIACDSPDRDILDAVREATAANPKPVVMFVERSDPGLADQAVAAGVAAYVVDGLQAGRVRPVLEVAMSRFGMMQKLRADLSKAQADLAARKDIERAKGLLMKERGIDEEAAFRLLRKLAMDAGRPLGMVAADLLAFAGVLKGGEQK